MPEEPLLSVVIPVWRDENALTRTLQCVHTCADVEVIVACAVGEEPRYERLRDRHPAMRWVSAPRGRAVQMNAGAAGACGRWLLFLHADSELPTDWLDAIRAVDNRADIAGGAFRLALDSQDWRARAIETGVRLRVALLRLPYGDQALFVRRHIFESVGGYRDLPLMEDIDLVRRVKKIGRLVRAQSSVVTSARRWEREGWWRHSSQNLALATQFLLGASPTRLAQRYFGRKRSAVVMMARAPWTGGKTRLGVAADIAHADLRHALFLDTLDVLMSIPDVEHIIACEPASECERLRSLAGPGFDVLPQRGDDLGQRTAHVFEDVFRLGVESVVVIGSDLPDLPPRFLREALAEVCAREDRIVLGPAADGGYYLIGMNRLHPELFDGVEWSSNRVLAQTLDAARASSVQPALLDTWTDIDEPGDLHRLLQDSPNAVATRTRAWVLQHSAHCYAATTHYWSRA